MNAHTHDIVHSHTIHDNVCTCLLIHTQAHSHIVYVIKINANKNS
jgi:hypothetical protein